MKLAKPAQSTGAMVPYLLCTSSTASYTSRCGPLNLPLMGHVRVTSDTYLHMRNGVASCECSACPLHGKMMLTTWEELYSVPMP